MNTEQQLRKEFLTTVEGIVNNDRASQYGGAEDSFLGIAAFWTIYLRNKGILASDKIVNALDVALMMDLMKTARLTANPTHYDSWIDKAGYAACGGSLVGKKEEAMPTPTVENYYPADYTTEEAGVWKSIGAKGNDPVCVGEKGLLTYALKNNYYALRMSDGTIWRRGTGLDLSQTKKKDSDATASKPFVPATEDPASSTADIISRLSEFIRKVGASSNVAPHLVDLPKAGLGLIKYQFTEALHNEEGWTNLVSEGFLASDWELTQEQALHAMKGYGNMLALRTNKGAILATEGDWSNQDYVVCQTTFVAYRKKAGKNIKPIEELTNGNNPKVIFGYDDALRYMKAHGVYSLVTQTGKELLVNGLWK